MVAGEMNVRVTFVITQQHIEPRLVQFDEIEFKYECFKLGGGNREVDPLGYIH